MLVNKDIETCLEINKTGDISRKPWVVTGFNRHFPEIVKNFC